MFVRLKMWFRKLFSGKAPDPDLDVVIRDRKNPQLTTEATYQILGSYGLQLVGLPKDWISGQGDGAIRLVKESEAVDGKHFWRLWRHHNPGVRLTWESNGTRFRPK